MQMKRISTVLLSLTMATSLAACSSGQSATPQETGKAGTDTGKKVTINWFEGSWEDPVPPPDSEAG